MFSPYMATPTIDEETAPLCWSENGFINDYSTIDTNFLDTNSTHPSAVTTTTVFARYTRLFCKRILAVLANRRRKITITHR